MTDQSPQTVTAAPQQEAALTPPEQIAEWRTEVATALKGYLDEVRSIAAALEAGAGLPAGDSPAVRSDSADVPPVSTANVPLPTPSSERHEPSSPPPVATAAAYPAEPTEPFSTGATVPVDALAESTTVPIEHPVTSPPAAQPFDDPHEAAGRDAQKSAADSDFDARLARLKRMLAEKLESKGR